MISLTAMLTGKQAGALANALAMLGAPAAPGGALTDNYLRSVDPALLQRAGQLCGPRTAMLCATFTQAAPVHPSPVAPVAAPVAPVPVPEAPAVPATVPAEVAPATPKGAPSKGTAADLFGIASEVPVTVLPGGKPQDRHYLFRADLMVPLLAAWNTGQHVWTFGPPGTGKTTMFREVAARTGRPFFRINFADGIDRTDLIGSDTLRGGDMSFRPGALLTALRTPFAVILLDEPTFGKPEDLAILHPILDGSGASIIPQTGEPIEAAPGVSIAVADNSRGGGDRSGSFHGLRPHSAALKDRFGVWIEVPHLTLAQEAKLLRKRVPTLDKAVAVAIATTVNASRELARKEEFPEAAISHRQAVAWALMLAAGLKDRAAFDCTVAARHEPEVAEALGALFAKNFHPAEVAIPAEGAEGAEGAK